MRGAQVRAAVWALIALAGGTRLYGQEPPYHVREFIPIGGAGRWGAAAVDTASQRLFVAHAGQIEVVDLVLDTLAGVVPGTPGVRAIAVADALGRGFASDGTDSAVTVFDLRTLTVTDTLGVGAAGPGAIVYDPVSRRVFTMNGPSRDATGLDAETGLPAGTVPLGGRPASAVADGRGLIYANLADRGAVVAFDARSLSVVRRWSLAPCRRPTALAMDRAHRRLFSGCANGVLVVSDADAGRIVATAPIGRGVGAAAFDPASGLVFAACGADAVVTIVHEDDPDHYRVVGGVRTRPGAGILALDPLSHRVFLPVAQLGPARARGGRAARPAVVPGTFGVLVLDP